MKTLFQQIAWIIALVSQSSFAAAPASSPKTKNPMEKQRGAVVEGNGGENITNEENPWFLNGAPVRYCINSNAVNFSVPLEQARADIENAFKTWIDIIPPKAFGGMFGPIYLTKSHINWLALDFNEVSCAMEHELEFLLGSREESLDEAMKFTAKNTIAISVRDEYSDQSGSGKGRIWFAADKGTAIYGGPSSGPGFWSVKSNFFNGVMHELGHVFGIRHTPQGFMAAEFPSYLIQTGMESKVGLDTLSFDYKICGKIVADDARKSRASQIIKRVFGLDLATIQRACLTDLVGKPAHFPLQKSAEYLQLSFFPKDRPSLSFEAKLGEKSTQDIPILGQYLGEIVPYIPQYLRWYFATFNGPSLARGIQNANGQDYFMLMETPFPGMVSIDFGIDGEWEGFTIVKESQEVKELHELVEENTVTVTNVPFDAGSFRVRIKH